MNEDRDYDPSIAKVYVSDVGSPADTAQAMHRDVNGEASAADRRVINKLARMVLGQMADVGRRGRGLYDEEGGLAAAAAELSWQVMLEKNNTGTSPNKNT